MNFREKYIPKNSSIAIVDFDNFVEYSKTNSESEFTGMINEILSTMLDDENDYYLIRIYGGWYSQGILTRYGSIIQSFISSINYFPLSIEGKIVRGEVELANSLSYIDNFIFEHTYRIKNGLPNIRLDKDLLNSQCINSSDNCPARLLAKFTKKKNKKCSMPSCTVINKDAFKYSEQKMVDTMMSIDIVDFGDNNDVTSLTVLSNDTDLVPSVIRSTLKHNKTKVIASQSSTIGIYNEIETRFNLKILNE